MDKVEYSRTELAKVAPWIAEEVEALDLSLPDEEAHDLTEWLHLVTSNHSELWYALDAHG